MRQDVQVQQSPAQMLMALVNPEKGLDVDALQKLEGLLTLQERWETNEARKAYHEAMTAFKANPPKIHKDKQVAYNNTKYKHATLSHVTEVINKALSEHGLSASWTTKQNGMVEVTCKITHIKGHSEETTLSAPADNSGAKNAIQAIGSTITYLQRYTLLALTGLAADEDDDGQKAGAATATDDDLAKLQEWMIASETTEAEVLKWAKVESLSDLTKPVIEKAINGLKAKAKAKGGK